MLDSMDAGQIAEWQAFDKFQEEAHQRETMKAKAEAGVNSYKRRGRR